MADWVFPAPETDAHINQRVAALNRRLAKFRARVYAARFREHTMDTVVTRHDVFDRAVYKKVVDIFMAAGANGPTFRVFELEPTGPRVVLRFQYSPHGFGATSRLAMKE